MSKRIRINAAIATMVALCVASVTGSHRSEPSPAELANLPTTTMPAIVVVPTREERIAAFATQNPGGNSELDMPFFSFGGAVGLE